MFVKWECGCIGIKSAEGNIVIESCDGESEKGFFFRGHMDEKDCKPLPFKEVENLAHEINHLMSLGHAMKNLKLALDSV